MNLIFPFVLALIFGVGCSRKDSTNEASPSTPTKQSLISDTQWCTKSQLDDFIVYTRYNFTYKPGEVFSSLVKDRIMNRRDENTQVYLGEMTWKWALQEKNSAEANIHDGYSVELVSDSEKIADMINEDEIQTLDGKPPHSALILYSGVYRRKSLDKIGIRYAYPCASLMNTNEINQKSPRSYAEFQILFGQEIAKFNNLYKVPEFWNTMLLQDPIQEVSATPEGISSHAWCAWDTLKTAGGLGVELHVTVKVFLPNGSMSSQIYTEVFRYTNAKGNKATKIIGSTYADYATKAERGTWNIDSASGRLNWASSPVPTINKMVQDKEGRNSFFALEGNGSEHPHTVILSHVYRDCGEAAPLEYQNGWSEWLPKIIEFQTKATR